jgi:energy-coupling factor transporter ATP-binding protein EcfA2
MPLEKINIENFTAFDSVDIEFSKGLNIFIGENGTGKTHLLKILYAVCQAAQAEKTGIDFMTKLGKIFRPDDFDLSRLVRRGSGAGTAKINARVAPEGGAPASLSAELDARSPKKKNIEGDDDWKKLAASLSSTFIPAKEILSNARNLIQALEKGNVDFDDTYKDIISAASVNQTNGAETETRRKKYLKTLQAITSGTVSVKNEEFYLNTRGQPALEFQLVAEGVRKIALLWRLIDNGALEKGSVLFWDEPEANVNPVHIPILADMLLELQRDGVQIFIATHDYFVAKYLGVRRKKCDAMRYHSLYQDKKSVFCESADSFEELRNNHIMDTFIALYKEEIDKAMKS